MASVWVYNYPTAMVENIMFLGKKIGFIIKTSYPHTWELGAARLWLWIYFGVICVFLEYNVSSITQEVFSKCTHQFSIHIDPYNFMTRALGVT